METYSRYKARMLKRCPQFKRVGVDPAWHPGKGDIEGFCHDEVIRQGHNPRVRGDGGVRVDWMLAAWEYARRRSLTTPNVLDILSMGHLVEPYMNDGVNFRSEAVTIGGNLGAPPWVLRDLVRALCERPPAAEVGREGPHADDYRTIFTYAVGVSLIEGFWEMADRIATVDDWYLAYEAVHPFADGNGRTGKILYNWYLSSLDDPVLVADHFKNGNP